MPASKFSYTIPIFNINEEFKEQYVQDIAKNKPAVIVEDVKNAKETHELILKLKEEKSLNYSKVQSIGHYDVYTLQDA